MHQMRGVRVLELISCFFVSIAYVQAGFANDTSIDKVPGRTAVGVDSYSCQPFCDRLQPKIIRPREKIHKLKKGEKLIIECHVSKTMKSHVYHYPILMWLCHESLKSNDSMCLRRIPSGCPDTALSCTRSEDNSTNWKMTYTKERVLYKDNGTYVCVADTSDRNFVPEPGYDQTDIIVRSSDETQLASLKYLQLEPKIVSPISKFEYIIGENITIECNVTKEIIRHEPGYYPLKIWFCDNDSDETCRRSSHTPSDCPQNALSCTESSNEKNKSLSAFHIIQNAKLKDSGAYYCVARAREKYYSPEPANTIVEVIIQSRNRLEFKKKPVTSIKTRLQNNVDLICVCGGYPEPSITWYKNDQPIQNETKKWIRLQNISQSDEGSYHCVCKNRFENITSEKSTLVVEETSGQRTCYLNLVITVGAGALLGFIVSCVVVCLYAKYKRRSVNYAQLKNDVIRNSYINQSLDL